MSFLDFFRKSLYPELDGSGRRGISFADFQTFLSRNGASLSGGGLDSAGLYYRNEAGDVNPIPLFDNNISSVDPDILIVGDPTNITVVGENFTPSTTFSDGANLTINSVTVNSPTSATVNATAVASGDFNLSADVHGDASGTTATVMAFSEVVVPGDGTTTWDNAAGVNTSEGYIEKTAATSAWDAAGTFGSVASGEDFVLDFTAGDDLIATRKAIFGLVDSYVSANWTDTEYGIYFGNTSLEIVAIENGSVGSSLGSYTPNDKFSIRRVDEAVTLYKNGILIHTYADSSSEAELIAKASINTQVADFKDISLKIK